MMSEPASQTRSKRPSSRGTTLKRELYLVLILLALSAFVAVMEPRFLSAYNLQQILLSATLVSVVAIGQSLVIIARQIDISVGPIAAASAFISADMLAQNPSTPLLLIFLLGAGIGVALGGVNAFLVAGCGIPAIVATLGTFAMFRGAIIIFAEGRQISATSLPPNFVQLAEVMFLGLPLLVWVAVVLVAAFSLILRFTRFGRNLYAIGSNPEGARLAGISETRHVAAAFAICGLLSGLVGVLWSARFGTVHAAIAPNLHIDTILACVLGGISIFGGSGTIIGAVIGALIIAVLQNGVLLLGVSQFWIQAIIGAAIVTTVTFYSIVSQRAETRLRRERRRSRRTAGGEKS